MVTLFTWQDAEGTHRHLGTTSTAALLKQFKKDTLRKVEARAEARIKENQLLAGEELKDEEAPWWEIMRRYQRSKEPALNKHLMMRAHGSSLLVGAQLQQWGYEDSGECTCCKVQDTAWRRVTTCKRGQQLRQGKDKQRRVRTWQKWQLDLACSPGLRSTLSPNRPMEELPEPQDIQRAFIGDDEVDATTFRFVAHEPVAADGSATNVRWGQMARAGWAAVQLVDGELRWIGGTVSKKNGQNAITAEHEAATAAVEHGAQHSLAVDCAAVLLAANAPDAHRCKHNKVHAGYWRRVALTQRRQGALSEEDLRWHKVPAHVQVPTHQKARRS